MFMMKIFGHGAFYPKNRFFANLRIPTVKKIWKLLFQRLIWHIWGPATCILWPVRSFVILWESTGSISWNLVRGVLIDELIPSLWTCHRKMEFVIVIGWSVFQGSVQISQATMSWENIHPYSLKKSILKQYYFHAKTRLVIISLNSTFSELRDLPVSRNLRKRCRSWQRDILVTGYK